MSFLNGLAGDIDDVADDVENAGGDVVSAVESVAQNPTVDTVAGDIAPVLEDAAPLLG